MVAINNVYNFWLQSVQMHNTVSTITITNAGDIFLQFFYHFAVSMSLFILVTNIYEP